MVNIATSIDLSSTGRYTQASHVRRTCSAEKYKQPAGDYYAGTGVPQVTPLSPVMRPQTTLAYIAPHHEVLCASSGAQKSLKQRRFEQSQTGIGVGRGYGGAKRLDMVHKLATVLGAEVGFIPAPHYGE